MQRYTVAVLVRNQFGVLNRVTSMFRRRRFNIDSLTVSETESADYSRITVQFAGEEVTKQQLVNQLYKLPDICSIRELEGASSISFELLLIKLRNDPAARDSIRAAADAFKAETGDYTRESIVLRVTADSVRIDSFLDLMRDYDILEICRTGVVSLERGAETIRSGMQV